MDFWEVRDLKFDLEILADLIDKYNIPCETTQIYNLIGKFYNLENFQYQLENIVFKVQSKISGSQPDMDEYTVVLNNTLYSKPEKCINIDNIDEYLFEINIDGYVLEDDNYLKSCWHLDKHIESKDDSDGIPKFVHPSYHFQFGGEYIEECDKGELGILANPRIPHPPMDIFLGFNFIINNFFNRKDYNFVNELLSDEDYLTIIRKAQERLWKPYFKAFEFSCLQGDFTIDRVFPLYIN